MTPDHGKPVLLIAAHGERGGEGTNRRLADIAAATARLLPGHDVRHGVLSGEPSLEHALGGSVGKITVFPLFMAQGYFVLDALPKRLEKLSVAWTTLPALGANTGFARLAGEAVLALSGPEVCEILVAAHGSTKDTRSRRATEEFAMRLALTCPKAVIRCAYLEEPPFVREAVAGLERHAIIISLFAGDGLHGGGDIPQILEETGFPASRVITPAAEVQLVARVICEAVNV